MGEALEEVVLRKPDVIPAQFVRVHDLINSLAHYERLEFWMIFRYVHLVEDAELQVGLPGQAPADLRVDRLFNLAV